MFAGSKLNVLPRTCGLRQFRRAVVEARKRAHKEPIVVLFHPHSFLESGNPNAKLTLEQFVSLLDWVADQEDVEVLSIRQLLETRTVLDEERLRANLDVAADWVPRFIRRADKLLYYPTESARAARTRVQVEALLAYALCLAICFGLRSDAWGHSKPGDVGSVRRLSRGPTPTVSPADGGLTGAIDNLTGVA